MNSYTSKWSLMYLMLLLFLISGMDEIFSRDSSETKKIKVQIFETSTRDLIPNPKVYLERLGEKQIILDLDSIDLKDDDKIICERRNFINISVKVKNIAKLKQINLYLNDNMSNENECRFNQKMGALNGKVVGRKDTSYIVYSEKGEWVLVNNQDNTFSRCFSKRDCNKNNTLKVFIKEVPESYDLKSIKALDFNDNRNVLTLEIDHYNEFDGLKLSSDDNKDSDLTIDVYMDDGSKNNPPK